MAERGTKVDTYPQRCFFTRSSQRVCHRIEKDPGLFVLRWKEDSYYHQLGRFFQQMGVKGVARSGDGNLDEEQYVVFGLFFFPRAKGKILCDHFFFLYGVLLIPFSSQHPHQALRGYLQESVLSSYRKESVTRASQLHQHPCLIQGEEICRVKGTCFFFFFAKTAHKFLRHGINFSLSLEFGPSLYRGKKSTRMRACGMLGNSDGRWPFLSPCSKTSELNSWTNSWKTAEKCAEHQTSNSTLTGTSLIAPNFWHKNHKKSCRRSNKLLVIGLRLSLMVLTR